MGKVGPLIYVVDDKVLIAQSLVAVLIQAGFRAAAFDDPLAALSAFPAHSPDILVADVVMPGMTGIELAIRIRHVHPACKVLLLSGQIITGELLEKASRDGHHFDILAKPIHPDEILARLRDLV